MTMDLETAMDKLEAIVTALETGKVPLEESLHMYEEGVALLRSCTQQIQEGRTRVEVLTRKGDEMVPIPLEEDEDEI